MENRNPKINSILVATDFSECAQAALRQALWLAEQTRAELTVVHVLSDVRRELCDMPAEARQELFGGDIDRFERELRRKADRKLETLVAPHRRRGLKLNYETLLGVPFVEIIHAVQQEGYNVVLAGTRGQESRDSSLATRRRRCCARLTVPSWR
jgi:nucleotide-binding universal stress UspA family protein